MLLILLSLAHADIPPPPDYVESCTIAKQCKEGEEGTTCRASYQGREECEALEAQGWVSRCSTYGASVRAEVLCRPATTAPAPSPPAQTEPASTIPEVTTPPSAPAKTGGPCATGPSTGVLGVLLSVGLALRRR